MRAAGAHRTENKVAGANGTVRLHRRLAKFKKRPRRRHGSIGMVAPSVFEVNARKSQKPEVEKATATTTGYPQGQAVDNPALELMVSLQQARVSLASNAPLKRERSSSKDTRVGTPCPLVRFRIAAERVGNKLPTLQTLQGASACRRSGRRQSSNESLKRGPGTKIQAVDAHGMPVRIIVTDGTTAHCTQADPLIKGVPAENLIADKAYDSNEMIEMTKLSATAAIIPSKKNRKEQRDFDRHLYQQRHLVESAFLKIKQRRGIATRYAKRVSSFIAAAQIRCLALWLHIS